MGKSLGIGDEDAADKNAEAVLPVEDMYNKAAALLDDKQYMQAAALFEDVEREYPYSAWATRAQLMAGFAYYRNLRYTEAIIALDRFIALHPGDKDIAYAYYLRSLCYYEQISDVRRDQQMTILALEYLGQVVDRFPNTSYARDAQLKIDLTNDHLAGKEMDVGRFYQKRGQYQAALQRYQKVVNDYQTTIQVAEALHRLVECYMALGIRPEAEKAAAILGHNYPGSVWYQYSYKLLTGQDVPGGVRQPSLFDRTIGSVIN
jgi:outer membrane protein assembly factor BamD